MTCHLNIDSLITTPFELLKVHIQFLSKVRVIVVL